MTILTVPFTPRIRSIASDLGSVFLDSNTHADMSQEEKTTLLLIRDLVRLGWRLGTNDRNSFKFAPPADYSKDVVKTAMAYSRNAVLQQNNEWIKKHLEQGRANLGVGRDVLFSRIEPRIEVCTDERSRALFRFFRYSWSSPYSEYVGRRLRFIIRDDGVKGSPVIGIAALGSSIIHIPDRDKWIGWDTATRTDRIVSVMDAYVVGALPPYNHILGGKLVSLILASNEVRRIYKEKYQFQKTLLNQREASELVLLITTSLYGKNSSQYNRLKFGNEILFHPIGTTAGYGSLHISRDTFDAMKALVLERRGQIISHKFGDGPNWRMRLIRTACDIMGLNSEVILHHSFKRGLYTVPLAHNWKDFLQGRTDAPSYKDLPLRSLVEYWRNRWLKPRLQNPDIRDAVNAFQPRSFDILPTPL